MADYKAGNLSVEFFGIDKSLSGTLQDIINRLEKLESVTANLGKSGNKSNKNSFLSKFNLAFAYGKIKAITQAMIRMGRVASKILQYGVDYTETLNLWQVAMGDNLSMAQDFVTQMNRAYGISEKTLMNAQAIFKNMIGSLGQISDTMAYNLSEAITQMAIDYASLYNVSIDAAITKFQAALAGQVRPIRSVSGYDITENTLYQLYQSIGGTKTMRQLSRTEKQLLSIYAIFQQMGASGALGDMEKTIDQVANQSRMMAENWEQLATWAGVSLQYILQEYDVFKYINAALIFASEVLKSIAFSLGYETPDFANSWADNVSDTEEAVEELQGKLLDFDKFRSLSGAEENVLGIDTKLMEALSGYTSNIGNATNEARKLAEQWLEILGFEYDAETGTYKIGGRLESIINYIKEIKEIFSPISDSLWEIFDALAPIIRDILKAIMPLLEPIAKIITDILVVVLKLVEVLTPILEIVVDILEILEPILEIVSIIVNFISKILVAALDDVTRILEPILAIFQVILNVVHSIVEFIRTIFSWDWGNLGENMSGIWSGTWTRLKNAFTGKASLFANGGMPDKGTMFVAGEAGAEMVYNMRSGQSGVANIEQIQQAMYGAMVAYGRTQGGSGDQPIVVQIDGEKVFQATKKNAKRHGYAFAKV